MLGFRSDMAEGYVSPWVTSPLTRLGRWLVRNTRQVQHNMSYRGVLSWKRIQAKSWTCNVVSLWIQFDGHTQISHLKRRIQNMYNTCRNHINHGRTWLCCWKVNNAAFHTRFCRGVGQILRSIRGIMALRQNFAVAIVRDCCSWSNRLVKKTRVLNGWQGSKGGATVHAV